MPNVPGPAYNLAQFARASREMTERIHAYGGKVWLQISGSFGRVRISTNLEELGVEVRPSTRADEALIAGEKADAVFFAIGSRSKILPLEGKDIFTAEGANRTRERPPSALAGPKSEGRENLLFPP